MSGKHSELSFHEDNRAVYGLRGKFSEELLSL